MLDGCSLQSILISLERILSFSRQTIEDKICSVQCTQYVHDQCESGCLLSDVFVKYMIQEGARIQLVFQVCWFHGTRVLNPGKLREGIRQINEQVDLIWDELFGLSRNWVTREKWQKFRHAVEVNDPCESSQRYRHRIETPSDFGPTRC
jgi:hypothetical protein